MLRDRAAFVAGAAAVGALLVGVLFGWADWAAQGIFADDHAPHAPVHRVQIVRSAIEGAFIGLLIFGASAFAVVVVAHTVRRRRHSR